MKTSLVINKHHIVSVNKNEAKYLICALVCELVVLLTYDKAILAYGFALFQLFVLVILLLKKDYVQCCCYYLIFILTTLEEPGYYGVDATYGLKNLRFAGITAGTWVSIIIFVVLLAQWIHNGVYYQRKAAAFKWGRKVFRILMFLSIYSLVAGCISFFLLNDNNIRSFAGADREFFMICYGQITLVLIPVCIFYFVGIMYPERIKDIKNALLCSLGAIVIGQVFSFSFGITGVYFLSEILIVSLVYRYGSFLILEGTMTKSINRKWLLFFGIIGLGFSIIYPTGSAQLFLSASVAGWLIILLIQEKRYDKLLLAFGAIILAGVVFFVIYSNTESHLFDFKVKQLMSVLTFWKDDWYWNMPSSARERIDELINIFIEYKNNPLGFVFGKGLMGSTHDWGNYFVFGGKPMTDAFSDFQNNSGLYYVMHLTMNNLWLSNGLVGVVLMFYLIYLCIKHLKYSFLLAPAAMWLFLVYRYMTTLSMFGTACMIIGFLEVDMKLKKNLSSICCNGLGE